MLSMGPWASFATAGVRAIPKQEVCGLRPQKTTSPLLDAAQQHPGWPGATSPYPLGPPSPTLPPCPPARARPPHTSRPRRSPTHKLRAGPLLGRLAACPALFLFVSFGPSFTRALGPRSTRALADTTCSPLSIAGHFPPRPSASVRPAPWQIRLVPLCRLFRRPPTGPSDHRPASAWQIRLVPLCRLVRRPPTGPSDHRPASAWQIRLVPLCRLVRRRSNPSCAASLQARAGRKKRDGQFKATQTLRRSRIPQAEGAGLALPTAAGGGAATTCSCR